jgi:MFS transporter, DHA1 family, inner membrane transport protein
MAFPRKDAVNRVNLHSGIQALAQGGGAIFFLVFLLRSGISVPAALLAQAAILVGRFVLRPAILPLAKRCGLKPLLIFATLAMAVQYPLLPEVKGIGGMLFVLCIVTSVGEVCYWLSYNAYFASVGDTAHRGHQLGLREALVAGAGIIAPLVGAWALLTTGPRFTFAAVALIQAIAAVPLIGAPNIAIKQEAPGAFRAALQGVILVAIDGWIDSSYFFVWPIVLFVSLSENIPAYGGAMALAGLVGAVCGLLLGRHIDTGHGRRAVVIACAVLTLAVLLRAASVGSPWLAVSANALGSLVMPLLLPALGTATYNLAKDSPCPFRFHVATEAGWDVGCSAGCFIAALTSASGAPLSLPILLALPGIAVAAGQLWHYYTSKCIAAAVMAH